MTRAGNTPSKNDSSIGDLSSPPSGLLSAPGSPFAPISRRKAPDTVPDFAMDEIVVSSDQRRQQQTFQQYKPPGQESPPPPPPPPQQPATTGPNGRVQPQKKYELIDGKWVQLTAAGVPRKKPGRKPGTYVKPKPAGDEAPKTRRPRKPRDPDAPPIQRKRKGAPTDVDTEDSDATSANNSLIARQATHTPTQGYPTHPPAEQRYSPKIPKREGYPSSMRDILNADPPAPPTQTSPSASSSMPVRTSGQSYDPIRGAFGPSRDSASNSQTTHSATGSPRGPAAQTSSHRSPSIASLLEPTATNMSPSNSHSGYNSSRAHGQMPPSPSPLGAKPVRSSAQEANDKPAVPKPVINQANFTTIANGPIRKVSPHGTSTPKTDTVDDMNELDGRSILDFGKVKPGEEVQAPSIVIKVSLAPGENNKYVNFMRLAEDRYGWDALHPRLAANKARKARIAAATANLEKVESGRESGDEMSIDGSDGEGSNQENGATSGADAQAKPKKKRNFKEDQYDVDDDFVDDSEMLWEAQAAASRDGFFVYSGPLVPEVEKPAPGYVFPFLQPMNYLINMFLALKDLLDVDVVAVAEAAEVVQLAAELEQVAVVVLVLVEAK